ncbi:MAG: 1-(5-phosphoribosyl)-5-[(5-phosphoribosylamino)methylideneamino]imidazole-4-carboxamide isomerase [SAR324 cluster bacterium]|nr:1-(5-phosphoribosyl)-5-[(5-phosphoribosylamino)methylideneamino]imidazole-4-carboxamide isomerase [SAR324 cluster bacterium]MEC9012333.1 1-(5-phosphoribosyl)-5-[(5-phosphoribosylamino)methylideneamino]imidazole-4-carboxamide isomerase [SAR324 cluster bacterium]MEC9383162.1 1-(5-phosphoribosyl)-5-[(5-phosphoribosylamino)methylideneamino]imidazole-4-carboxamide isomerase [SAR324 cluster bacterium]MEC9461384.1 1-(5-phosphoribosyl)-5-[(5-phosphoribosylamino)methylideneamino]imidazole-4-carboxamid
MLLIPAIDLKNGRCVRLIQGEAAAETVYSDDPASMARSFEDAGAKRLHLVDLDGAFKGKGANLVSIRSILKNISIPVQLGGGLRNAENIEKMFELGVSSVIVGTMAVKNPDVLEEVIQRFTGEKVILGIDARDRKVSIEGWQEGTEIDDVEFALSWKKFGIQRIVFTDIARDGMLSGPNLEALGDFARRTGLKIVASGGVSSMEDLELLKTLEVDGVDQVISGKAIYEGKLDLKEIFKC